MLTTKAQTSLRISTVLSAPLKVFESISQLTAGNSLRVCNRKIIVLTYVVGTQKNRLNEMVLFSTQKHMLKIMGKKMFLQFCLSKPVLLHAKFQHST